MPMKTGNHLKLSLFGLFSGILSFILTFFLTFSAYLLNIEEIYPVAIATFSAGLLLIIDMCICNRLDALIVSVFSYGSNVHLNTEKLG